MTPDLIGQASSAEEIDDLAWSLSLGSRIAAGMRAMRDRMRRFDTDGDGRLSDEEREAARRARQQKQ